MSFMISAFSDLTIGNIGRGWGQVTTSLGHLQCGFLLLRAGRSSLAIEISGDASNKHTTKD